MFLLEPLAKKICSVSFVSQYRFRSTQRHYLNKFGTTRLLNIVYQVSRSSALRFQRKIFSMVFTIYGHAGHFGHVTFEQASVPPSQGDPT